MKRTQDEDERENDRTDRQQGARFAVSAREKRNHRRRHSGRNKIGQAKVSGFQTYRIVLCARASSCQIFHVRGLAFAIERHDESEAHGDFRRRDRDDEKNDDLAVQVVGETGEGDQREIRRVEHQLQRHVNDQQIAPHDDAEQSKAEQQCADDQIMFEADVHDSKT